MGTPKGVCGKILIAAFYLFVVSPMLGAQEKGSGDLDAYKWRITAMWWYSHPSGSFNASSDQVSFDIDKDFGFGSYSTFTGAVDWHFKRNTISFSRRARSIHRGQASLLATSPFVV